MFSLIAARSEQIDANTVSVQRFWWCWCDANAHMIYIDHLAFNGTAMIHVNDT